MNDPYKLERFITAQNDGGTYCRAVEELRRGHKTSHWMWFVFPQIAGLGQSRMSRTYPLSSLAEAKAYLQHPVLGQRLIECAGVVASAQAWTGGADLRRYRYTKTALVDDVVPAGRA